MAKTKIAYIKFEEQSIAVNIYREWRKNARVSFGKNGLHLRLPIHIRTTEIEKYLTWAESWTKKQILRDPKLKAKLLPKVIADGYQFTIRERKFKLQLQLENRKTHSGKLVKATDNIILKLNKDDKDNLQSAIRRLISRIISAEYKEEIEKKVDYYNDRYFQEEISGIKLKYNRSNWGSCSAKRNINLSSRLLLAPDRVLDYVIIHELAHLQELNHSKKFWKIVSGVMPDFKEQERWLKLNGHTCDF